ncbi:MAG: tetratricopeptide repeat protein [bacterium]|nr:tetratricopeptide repeat protein [bacterium]
MDVANTDEKQGLFGRFGGNLFLVLTFLLPIFFIPSQSIPLQFGKGFFLVTMVLLLVLFFLVSVLKNGKIIIPQSLTLLGLCAILVSYVVSSALGAHQNISFFGQGFELSTTFLTLILVFLAILPTLSFKSKPKLFNIYITLLSSFFVVALFSIIKFFSPTALSLGVFSGNTANLIGTWNDLGAFAGFMVVLSLISLGALDTKGLWRTILRLVLFLGLVFLAIVNFSTLWILVGVFSLIFFLYSLSYAKRREVSGNVSEQAKKISWLPVLVLIVAVIFLIDAGVRRDVVGNKIAGPISSLISSKLNIVQLEARPSWGTTLGIGKVVLKENPLLGIGPNQFVGQWLQSKPIQVNESIFWNIDFSAGIGMVPTSIITLGLLGLFSWLLFFTLLIYEGVKAVRRLRGDAFSHYLVFSSFVSTIYLWLVAIFYTPTHVLYALAFIFTGIFVTTLILDGIVKERRIDFSLSPGRSFMGSLIVIVLLIGIVTLGYLATKRFVAFGMFNSAILTYSQKGDLNLVEASVGKILLVEENDLFYRTLSDIFLARLNALAAENPTADQVADLQTKFRQYLGGAIGSAQEAVKQNSENYLNQLQLAKVYEAIVPLKIPGAYEQAQNAYNEAIKLNPSSPSIRLAEARLEVVNGNNKKARDYIKESLALKSNYTDAIFLLTQIEVSEGNTKKAIEAVISATLISPTNPVVFFQLGLLYYNDANYTKAIDALEQATKLEPQYANAKYFLGISYDKLGRDNEAVKQFEELLVTNPDSAEVKFILGNLKAGRPAFAEVAPPLDNKPEKRKTPPIPEKAKSSEGGNSANDSVQ